jgi:hypothetical protein
MEFDLFDLAMLGYALIGVGVSVIVIAWPLEGERCAARRIRARFGL